MKRNKMFLLKEILIVIILIFLSFVSGFGILSLERTSLLNEYKKSIMFNSNSYIKHLSNNIIDYSSRIVSIISDANTDPNVFNEFIYVARFSYNDSVEPEENTLSIKNDSLHSYSFYTISNDQCEKFLNSPFGLCNINTAITEENEYLDENLVYFSVEDEDTANYFYVLFMQQQKFFSNSEKFGIDECALIDLISSERFCSNDYIHFDYNLSLEEDGIIDYYDDGLIFYNSFLNNDVGNIIFSRSVSNESIVEFVNNNMLTVYSILFCYLIVILICVGLMMSFFISSNKFLKNYKINSSSHYILITDEFGNILKTNAEFKKNFNVKNIFDTQNIAEDFMKLEPKDSIYVKVKDKSGNEVLLNFLINKINDKYKLVGLETRNLTNYFMSEFGLGFRYLPFDMDNKAKLEKDYEASINDNFTTRIFGLISITNLADVGKKFGRDLYSDAQIKFAQTVKLFLNGQGNLYSFDNNRSFALYISNENNASAFLLHVSEILKNLYKSFVLENDTIFTPQIKAGFVIVDHTIPDLSFDNILNIAKMTIKRAINNSKEDYFIYHESQKELFETLENAFDYDKMMEDKIIYICYQPIYSSTEKKFTLLDSVLKLRGDKYKDIIEEEIFASANKNNKLLDLTLWNIEKCMISVPDFISLNADEKICIKIPAAVLLNEKFFDELKKLSIKYALSKNSVILSLTKIDESANISLLAKKLNEIKDIGINYIINNVGAQNNLFLLAQLLSPFAVRIDAKLTNIIKDNPDMQYLITGLFSLSKKLKLHTMIENITEKNQVDFANSVNCNYMQGDYYSEPKSKDLILELLKE